MLFAHITFCIPYVILSVMPKFKQLENHTYEAALDLGATPIYAFFKVVLPDIMPGIVSGFLLSFTMSVDDFVITHFTRGGDKHAVHPHLQPSKNRCKADALCAFDRYFHYGSAGSCYRELPVGKQTRER